VIASLANYFGERPLDVHLWDSDPERLDLFDRFARLCFRMNKSKHSLMASEETQETLVDASAIVLMVGENCASKYLKARGSLLGHGETHTVLVQRCVAELLQEAPLDAQVLSLIPVEPDGHDWTQSDWPPEPTEAERKAVPHQILRYLNGGDYPHALLKQWAATPVTAWLNSLS
jgi:hypothetical protein